MIDSKHLKLILAIDELGSLSKAAVELNLTQSALSHQLKNLASNKLMIVLKRENNSQVFGMICMCFYDVSQQYKIVQNLFAMISHII